MDERPDAHPGHRLLDVARLHHVEDEDRQTVVHAQRYGGGVHHLELAAEDVDVGQLIETGRAGVLERGGRAGAGGGGGGAVGWVVGRAACLSEGGGAAAGGPPSGTRTKRGGGARGA